MRAAALIVLGAIACGGGDSNSPKPQLRPTALAVVTGAAQLDTVLGTLPDPVVVAATASGTPVPNQPIVFTVIEPGCGASVPASTTTNVDGEARTRWTLGAKAGICHLEARAIDQTTGAPIVVDTAVAQAQPLAAATWTFEAAAAVPTSGSGGAGLTFASRQSFAFHYFLTDRLGNVGATEMPAGGNDMPAFVYADTLVHVDSVIPPLVAGARHGYAAGMGWAYFTAVKAGTATIRPWLLLAPHDTLQGATPTVTITP